MPEKIENTPIKGQGDHVIIVMSSLSKSFVLKRCFSSTLKRKAAGGFIFLLFEERFQNALFL